VKQVGAGTTSVVFTHIWLVRVVNYIYYFRVVYFVLQNLALRTGIRCLFYLRIRDLGSWESFRIPNLYFWGLNDNFWIKNSIFLCILAQNFLHLFKYKIIYNFVIFVATKKVGQQIFLTLLFSCYFVSETRDPGSEIRDPRPGIRDWQKSGSGINIRIRFTGPRYLNYVLRT